MNLVKLFHKNFIFLDYVFKIQHPSYTLVELRTTPLQAFFKCFIVSSDVDAHTKNADGVTAVLHPATLQPRHRKKLWQCPSLMSDTVYPAVWLSAAFPWSAEPHPDRGCIRILTTIQAAGPESGPYRGSEWRTNKRNWQSSRLLFACFLSLMTYYRYHISGLQPGEVWTLTRGSKMWHIVSGYCAGNTQDTQNTA